MPRICPQAQGSAVTNISSPLVPPCPQVRHRCPSILQNHSQMAQTLTLLLQLPESKQPCENQPSSPHAKSNYVKDTGRALRGADQKPETREAAEKPDQIHPTLPSLRIRNGAFCLINSTSSKFKPKSPEGNKEKAINNNSNHFPDAPV